MMKGAATAVAQGQSSTNGQQVKSVLALAMWLAILLGLAVQLLILFAKITAGGRTTTVQVVADVASGITWSALVCSAVAVGTVAARNRAEVMGLLGLISAPVAWASAKGAQRGVQWMLGAPLETLGPLAYQIGAAKTVEYAALGFLIGRLVHTPSSTLRNHALTGLAVGVVFGGVVLWLNAAHAAATGATLAPPRVAAICVNELLFPVGCAIVIYFIVRFADRHTALERLASGGG